MYGQYRHGVKLLLGNTCLEQHVQRKVGNGAIWPLGLDRNVVMAWGNVGSQKHGHDATCAHMALHGVILSHGIMSIKQ